eukprot:TRINITY_DN10574_c0_g1_i1.p1 TRINITY_DN10574_c0_g1~~TRINITY_DN10574_c0_g1_i1.p1  ORF type:complete len:183 (-),score=36.09 TRINITY_DN10574_c0_g1_i1:60-608(-)
MGCGGSTEEVVSNSSPHEVKIVMLGNGGVGKSAITFRFIQNKFIESYNPTIEDSYRKQVRVGGQAIVLDILDTAGQDEYTELREVYMRGGEGFIIVYSITDRKSFQEVSEFRDQTLRVKDKNNVPMVLIGNKSDLKDQRTVTTEEGEALAKRLGVPYIEASAQSGDNIEEVFYQIAKLITDK